MNCDICTKSHLVHFQTTHLDEVENRSGHDGGRDLGDEGDYLRHRHGGAEPVLVADDEVEAALGRDPVPRPKHGHGRVGVGRGVPARMNE